MPAREKRQAQATVHFRPTVKAALQALAEHEQRTFSAVVTMIVERDPHVQLFTQKVGVGVGKQ